MTATMVMIMIKVYTVWLSLIRPIPANSWRFSIESWICTRVCTLL